MSDKKHILILSSWYPSAEKPFLGNFVQRQSELLSSSFNITVLQLIGSDKKQIESVVKKDLFTEITIFYRKSNNKLFNYFRERKAFLNALKEVKRVDIIHGHVLLPKGYWFLWAKKKLRVPLIVTEHGSYFRDGNELKLIQKIIVEQVTKKINRLIVVSQRLSQDILMRYPQLEITVVPNHIDRTVFSLKEENSYKSLAFLHISTLAKIKNCEEIIEAFELFNSTYPTSSLTIVSDENFDSLTIKIKDYTSKKSIHFVGPLEWHQTTKYYQEADCFILNSEYESFSIVVAEAWSCGIPVIAPSVGIASNLPDFLGIQSSGTAKEDVLRSMKAFIERKDEFIAKDISSHAAQFDSEKVLKQLKQLYEEV